MDIRKAEKVTAREEAGIEVHLVDPDTDELTDPAVKVWIKGTYSPTYRRVQDQQTQRLIKRRQSTWEKDELVANRVELVVACIIGWDGFTDGSQPFPFSKDNATALLNSSPWVRDQLEAAQQNHASFGKGSSGT